MSINKLSNLSHASLKSYLSEVGAARQGFAWSPVDEWQSRKGMEKKVILEGCSTPTAKWSETHVRQVWLGTFFSGKLHCLVSWKTDLIMQCLSQRFCSYFTYTYKWQMSFFFLCDTFPCWQQKVKQILYFDKTNKNNKYAIFTFLYKLAYIIIYIFFLSATHNYVDNKNVKLIWFWTRRIK